MMFDVEKMILGMTLEEKASLMSGHDDWLTETIDSVGLPAIELGDGPHGLRKETGVHMVWHQATCFPTGSALGASWDRDAVRAVGAAIAEEAKAEGIQVILGPGINMKRAPQCGRNFEYFSEDPMHTGDIAAAYVEGAQGNGVGTCVKHFAANNQEEERTRVSVEADERTLREIYLAGFERVIAKANPWSVMCAYNRLHGVHASENRWLLTEVLREDWGYDGVVLSDWDAVHHRVPALVAGLDLEMPSTGGRTDAEIVAAVRAGTLDEAILDQSVRRVLTLVDRAYPKGWTRTGSVIDLGWAPGVPLTPEQLDLLGADEHHAVAREVAASCITLLRNENQVLPLSVDGDARIAVVGGFAQIPRIQGGGSAGLDPTRVDIPLDALREIAGDRIAFAPGFSIGTTNFYQDSGEVLTVEETLALADDAVALARESDIVLAYVGLPLSYEEEAGDRKSLALPPEQVSLLMRLAELGKPIVAVLFNGSAVTMDPWHDRVDAIVEGWLTGQAGAGAMADVLFGRVNPSGKLAESFPLAIEDTPAYLNFPGERGEVRYSEGVFIGYRWYDSVRRDVRYPFGHGLSYTCFEYSELDVEIVDPMAGEVRVSATITNTGPVSGREVVQLYIGDPVSAVRRPTRELKGFDKVSLAPGESVVIQFSLSSRDFAYYDVVTPVWRREGGEFVIEIAASSRDIRLAATISLPDDESIPALVPDDQLLELAATRFNEGHKA